MKDARPPLQDITKLKMIYDEGDVITHPTGAVYRRIQGDWVLIQAPPQ